MIGVRIAAPACAVILVASMAQGGDATPEPVPVQAVPPPPPMLQMSSPRAAHAAVTLADGRVAFIGGCVVDGCEAGPGSRTVEIFNPKTYRLSPGGALTMARIGAAAALLGDGRVLIAGGWNGRQTTASVELYDPARRASVAVGAMRTPRADVAAVVLNDGRVALIGGTDGRAAVSDVELFDPRTRRLTSGPSLGRPRAGAAGVRLGDGRVLVVGGAEGAGDLRPSASAEIADAALSRWSRTRPLAVARYKHAAVALEDGGAAVIGGSDARDRQGKISAVEVFDPIALAFHAGGATLTARFKIADAVVVLGDGRVFIGGGGERAEIYDPRTMRSTMTGPRLSGVRSFATASVLGDGRVVIAGGYEEDSIRVSRGVWVVKP